ncbi:hypothetical protein PRIPAC_97756 [Pristionchus pacificus]|uniref:G protein-coupled receptor n=1 Tax=Pristionchus pacificus TaxID=54126 RepID=A0A2A6D2E2_PRIPA|nr:hypothetical protein PRIPAC_97756 [Pristionchus pacificus]|eukprot:PDM84477.1 G protein-coupled receptor [Pristionchus pacificus]
MYYGCDGNTTDHACRFIAIYTDLTVVETPERKTFFIMMNIIEAIAHIVATFVVTLSMDTVRNCARFHPNIVRIFIFFISHSYVYSSSRFVIFFFQNGIVEIEGFGAISYYFLLFFSFLRMYHLFTCVFIFSAFCFERLLATIDMEEYEHRRDPTVSIVALSAVVAISTALGLDATCADVVLSLKVKLTIVVVVTVGSGVASLVLHSHNLRVRRAMEQHPHRYRLSTRFQIVENCRAFQLLRNVAVVTTTGISLASVGLIYSSIILTSLSCASIAGAIFDTLNAIVYTTVIVMCCFSQAFWRDEFKAKLGLTNICNRTVVQPSSNSESTQESHFAGLAKAWEAKNRPDELKKY